MFWFDSEHPNVLFGDIRREEHTLCDGRALDISPDVDLDFRDMPFPDGQFKLVVFDPPHLRKAGPESWMGKKYGVLNDDWRGDLRKGFAECFRVLATDGVLIFKWAEVQIRVSEILKLTPQKPLFGHKSGKRSNTHWLCFMKALGDVSSPLEGLCNMNKDISKASPAAVEALRKLTFAARTSGGTAGPDAALMAACDAAEAALADPEQAQTKGTT